MISKAEAPAGELRATLKRDALVREHYTTSQLVQCSLNGVTPLRNKPRRGSRSDSGTRHCTRYGTLHLLRDAAPDQNGCIAYVSGVARRLTSTTADTTAWHHPPHITRRISHAIPWRPYLAAPKKQQNSNVLISKVEAPAGELRTKFRGHTGTGTQLTTRAPHRQQTPAATSATVIHERVT